MRIAMQLFPRVLATTAAALSVLAVAPRSTLADDTEVFLNRTDPSTTVPPNVLFLLDTSYSMNTQVSVPVDAYVAGLTYDDPENNGCDPNLLYMRDSDVGANPPRGCVGLKPVSPSNFQCKTHLDEIDSRGRVYAVSQLAEWSVANQAKNSKWVSFAATSGRQIECGADDGIHGGGASPGTDVHAANGVSGPWSALANKKINWTTFTDEYDLFDGNYVNYLYSSTLVGKARIDILRDAMSEVIKDLVDKKVSISIGLMRYSNNGAQDTDGSGDGGMVIHPVLPLYDDVTYPSCTAASTSPTTVTREVWQSLLYTLNDRTASQDNNQGIPQTCTTVPVMKPDGPTPMGETLWESYNYWLANLVEYGNRSKINPSVELKSVLGSRIQPAGMQQGDRYKSPITEACGKNFTIIFSDGSTNQDRSADQQIVNLIATAKGKDAKCDAEFDPNDDSRPSDCVDDLSDYLFNNDLSSLDGVQNITTYTVGFDLKNNPDDPLGTKAETLLRDTAKRGGGKFFVADSADALKAVFAQIIREILVENTSFAAPTVTVNAFNRTQNLNELYMTVFRPDNSERWLGNVKKYHIDTDGNILGQDPDFIAVDPATGFFRKGSQSFWSVEIDGDDVTKGGAASKLPAIPGTSCLSTNRMMFTNYDSSTLKGSANNCVTPTNTALVNHLITDAGVTDAATAEKLLAWARGTDVDDNDQDGDFEDARLDMGDPLHARPVSVIYGGTAENPEGVVFAATNDGVLHAVDPDNGQELWSYIPLELLNRLPDLYENPERYPDTSPRSYGLDGNLRVYKSDLDGDGIVEDNGAQPDDVVYLFFGMRAGGDRLYAMNITDPSAPKLMWTMDPTDLPGIGQTWSAPVVAKVRVDDGVADNDDVRLVLVMGGGYDDGQDDRADFGYKDDDSGNRVFIIDAVNGTLVWSAGGAGSNADLELEKMTSGFAADVRAIDLSGDGLVDRMYASDIGGRVWRFDIWNGLTKDKLVTGGVIASLGEADNAGSISDAESRRFYYAPDPSLVTGCGSTFINIAIGSGNRAWPNTDRTVQNRIYGIRDRFPYARLTQAQYDALDVITDNDLDLINTAYAAGNISPALTQNGPGWRLDLRGDPTDTVRDWEGSWVGEKVLAESRTFAGKVFVPTYTPVKRQTTDACVPNFGLNQLYAINACTGSPAVNWDNQTQSVDSPQDVAKPLAQGSIAPEVTFIFPSPEDGTNCVGRDCAPPPVCLVGLENCGTGVQNRPVRTYWLQRERP